MIIFLKIIQTNNLQYNNFIRIHSPGVLLLLVIFSLQSSQGVFSYSCMEFSYTRLIPKVYFYAAKHRTGT
jgi:hypothetical protein